MGWNGTSYGNRRTAGPKNVLTHLVAVPQVLEIGMRLALCTSTMGRGTPGGLVEWDQTQAGQNDAGDLPERLPLWLPGDHRLQLLSV